LESGSGIFGGASAGLSSASRIIRQLFKARPKIGSGVSSSGAVAEEEPEDGEDIVSDGEEEGHNESAGSQELNEEDREDAEDSQSDGGLIGGPGEGGQDPSDEDESDEDLDDWPAELLADDEPAETEVSEVAAGLLRLSREDWSDWAARTKQLEAEGKLQDGTEAPDSTGELNEK
jgi:hypothetical protein